jgi:hypothetical protein
MTATVEATPLDVPDAGVIEDARARQTKHRWWLLAAAGVAVAVAATLLLASGGGETTAPQSRSGDAAPSITFASKHFSVGGMPIGITLDIVGATASFSFNGSYTP